jgi:hypothetical protein
VPNAVQALTIKQVFDLIKRLDPTRSRRDAFSPPALIRLAAFRLAPTFIESKPGIPAEIS